MMIGASRGGPCEASRFRRQRPPLAGKPAGMVQAIPLHAERPRPADLCVVGCDPAFGLVKLPGVVVEADAQDETLAAMRQFASPVQRFLWACRNGDEAQVRAILREQPGIMRLLAPEQHRVISDAAWHGDARAVALMLELGFDPRTPGQDSGTALHCAAWQGSVDTVAQLLRHPDARELVQIRDAHYGATPLGWCCHGSLHGNRGHDHAGVARLLLAAGAVLHAFDRLPGARTIGEQRTRAQRTVLRLVVHVLPAPCHQHERRERRHGQATVGFH